MARPRCGHPAPKRSSDRLSRGLQPDLVVELHQLEAAVAPGVDRAGAVVVLVHQADLLQHLPVVVVGLERHGVLIDLADLADAGPPRQIAAAATQLVAAQPGLHGPLRPVLGFGREERLIPLRPPAEPVALIPVHQFAVDLDAQDHVDPQHRIVLGEKEGAARAPEAQVAGEPTPQVAVEADAALHGSSPGKAWLAWCGHGWPTPAQSGEP